MYLLLTVSLRTYVGDRRHRRLLNRWHRRPGPGRLGDCQRVQRRLLQYGYLMLLFYNIACFYKDFLKRS